MGDENHIRTLGDYSKPSHEGYRNTIELLVGNNVVPLRSSTICGPHDTQYCMENPEQAFVKYVSSHTDEAREPEPTLKDEFQDLHLNLPVLEVLAHSIIYNAILDKYVESLELGKNGSAFVQREIPTKMENPGLFTLPCRFGDSKPFNTLANLGLCVNIMPLYLFKKLNIRLLEETDHIFGLADGTKSYPVGIVKNIEVHIRKLKLLNDFYIIDLKKDPEIPLLIGRGFLATANTVINCRMAKIAEEKESLDLEKEHTKSVYLRNEEDKRRGVEYVMSKILGFYKECLELGPEYLTGVDDEGEVTLYLMRRSLEVLRKFHWMILGGQFNQLSHVSSLLLSKPGEYKFLFLVFFSFYLF
ncbi:MAK10-like protein [Tanacetum coccineum]